MREASEYTYGYMRRYFIYEEADAMYKELTENGNKKKDVRLIGITRAYDATQPMCVIVKEAKTEVLWNAFCHYNSFWNHGELPVFRFDKTQYETALEQLKAIVDEQSKLPTAESLGNATYQGRLRNGQPAGYGVHTWSDGSKHEGIWKKGKRHGNFIYTDEKGVIRHEIWDNNMLIELP